MSYSFWGNSHIDFHKVTVRITRGSEQVFHFFSSWNILETIFLSDVDLINIFPLCRSSPHSSDDVHSFIPASISFELNGD